MAKHSKPTMIKKEDEMRIKKCNICGKIKKIHKFDMFCDSCRNMRSIIIQRNVGIF